MNPPLTLISDAVDLRLIAFKRFPYFRYKNRARETLMRSYQSAFEKSKSRGKVEYHYAGKKLLGFLLIFPSAHEVTGASQWSVILDLRTGSPQARKWALAAIKSHFKFFKKRKLSFNLMPLYKFLLPALYREGLSIDSVILIGNPKKALSGLKKRYGDLSWHSRSDFCISPVRSKAQILQVVEIVRSEFTRNPQYGWFCADERFIQKESANLRKSLEKKDSTQYIVVEGKRVVGKFGLNVTQPHPIWGSLAGLEICLEEKAQGKGLSKLIYATLLQRMIEMRIQAFSGGTSQKPVMHLSKIMDRALFAYTLHSGKRYFPRSHFEL